MKRKTVPRHAAGKSRLRVVGLMSGTSADGVDVAVVDFPGPGVQGLKVRAFATYPYPPDIRRQVFNLFDHSRARVDDLCHLNFVLGEIFGEAVIRLARAKRIPLASIDLIGSHGQTVCHIPRARRHRGTTFVSTLQIAEPCVIAERTGITTVADFRPRDIAAGGQGAPLVPMADFLMLSDSRKSRAVQNIGGIANMTWLPAGAKSKDVLAFDTGPGNMLIDRVTSIITSGRSTYDAGGKLAAKGRLDEKLFLGLMRHPFLAVHPPKTCGREEFGVCFADELYRKARRKGVAPLDILATVTAFTAAGIAAAYQDYLPGVPDEVILCGGGAHNRTLRTMLAAALGGGVSVRLIDDFGVSVDAKEAVSFAILARQTVLGLAGNVPSATGAAHSVVLGKIVPGKGKKGKKGSGVVCL